MALQSLQGIYTPDTIRMSRASKIHPRASRGLPGNTQSNLPQVLRYRPPKLSPLDYAQPQEIFCLVGKRHVPLCRCKRNESVRTWMRTKFNPSRGIHNLDGLWKEIKSLFSSPSENDEPWVENNPANKANQPPLLSMH